MVAMYLWLLMGSALAWDSEVFDVRDVLPSQRPSDIGWGARFVAGGPGSPMAQPADPTPGVRSFHAMVDGEIPLGVRFASISGFAGASLREGDLRTGVRLRAGSPSGRMPPWLASRSTALVQASGEVQLAWSRWDGWDEAVVVSTAAGSQRLTGGIGVAVHRYRAAFTGWYDNVRAGDPWYVIGVDVPATLEWSLAPRVAVGVSAGGDNLNRFGWPQFDDSACAYILPNTLVAVSELTTFSFEAGVSWNAEGASPLVRSSMTWRRANTAGVLK